MFRFKMFGFSSNKSTEPTNEKSWILDFVLGKTLNPKGQTVKVCRHINGPQADGSVVKQVSDCSVFINAVFTQEAIDNYNFDDDSCTPPEWDQAILIVKDYHLKFVPAPNVTDCEFLLVISKFSLLDVHDGFYSKNTARDCMEDPQVQATVKEKWTEWMEETKGHESYNDESQYTACQLSQLLEEIGQPDTQSHSQTEGSLHLSSPDDKMRRPETVPSKPLPARGHPSVAVSARGHPGEAMASALAKMKQPTQVEDLIISPEDLAILESLEEWKEDYHPPPSQDTTSSSGSSRTNFSQPTLTDSPRKRDHTGACKKSGKTQPGTSKLIVTPARKDSQSTARQNVSSDENRLTGQIEARESSFSQSNQANIDAECHHHSNMRADGQGASTSKEDIPKPNSSSHARPRYFSIKGRSRCSTNNKSQQDKKTPEGQGQSRTTDSLAGRVVQNTDSVDRSPQGFTEEYLKFLDSSGNGYQKDSTNKSKMADESNSTNISAVTDKSYLSTKSKMADKSDTSNKSTMADKCDSDNKSKMADENDICVIDVVTLCSLPTAWHNPSADSVEFSCSLQEDSQNSHDSQISRSSQSDPNSEVPESSETCAQSEIQAREIEVPGRGRSTQPDTRRVSFAPSAVMKCLSVDPDKVGSTQPFDVVNDSTYSMYEDAKSYLSNPDSSRPSSSHLDFPESQPFVPISQELLGSDSVEEKSKNSSSDSSLRKDCTDDCDTIEHLNDAHSTRYSDTVIDDTSFHHSTQTSGVTRKSTPDFLISPIRRVTRNGRLDKSDNADKSGSDSVYCSALCLPENQCSSAVIECVVKEGKSQKRSAVDKTASRRSVVRENLMNKTASQRSAVREKTGDKASSLSKSSAHNHPSFDESDSLECIPLSHGLCRGGNTGAMELSTPERDAEPSTTMVLTRSKRKESLLQSSQKISDPRTPLGRNKRKPVSNSKGNMTEESFQSPTPDKQTQTDEEMDKDQSDLKSDSEIIIEEYSTDSDVSKQTAQDQSQKDSLKCLEDKSAPGGQIVGADVHINMDVDSGQKADPLCTEGEKINVIVVSDEDEEHTEEITGAAQPKSGKEVTASKKRDSQKPSDKHPGNPRCHNIMEKYITTRRTRSSKQNDDAHSSSRLKLRSSRGVGPDGDASSQAKISPKCAPNNLEKGTATHGHKKTVTEAGKKGKKRSKYQVREVPETSEEEKQGPDHNQEQGKVIEVDEAEKSPIKKKTNREVEVMFDKAVEKYGFIGNVSNRCQAERCYGKPQKNLSKDNKKARSEVLCEAEDETQGAAQTELRGGAHKIHRTRSDKGNKHMHAGISQDCAEEGDVLEVADQNDIENIPVHPEGGARDSKQRKRAPAEYKQRQTKGIMSDCRGLPDPQLPSIGTWDVGRKSACRRVSSIRQESGIDSSDDVPTTQVLLDFLEMKAHPEHQPLLNFRVSPDLLHKICNIYRKPISYPD